MSKPFAGIAGLETYALEDETSRVEIIPARGALVTRMAVNGDEVLYLDEGSVADLTKNVRGGIPVLFPIAGALPGDAYSADGQTYKLSQHGFARRLPWAVRRAEGALLALGLTSSEQTRRQFPWSFDAQLTFSLAGRKLTLTFDLKNDDGRPLPLHLGYHPYFFVPQGHKAGASVETNATRAWDNRAKREAPLAGLDLAAPAEVDLHLRGHSAPHTTLTRGPGSPPVKLSWSEPFRQLVVWTLPGKDFVCVEPWTAAAGALATGEGLLQVPPGESVSLAFHVEA